jgi:very-short-patch-repair endonuclease
LQLAADSREAHAVRRAGAAAHRLRRRASSAARRKEKLMKASSPAQSLKLARQHGFARAMRSEPTPSERALWAALSGSKLGLGFRRQAVVAGRIVDFLAPSRGLVVEVDGGYHGRAAQQRADTRRDRRLERAGYRVLRLSAELVHDNVPEAGRLIRAALAAC